MSVELHISNKWIQRVERDDKLFSTFLEPYLELGEEMPERIEIVSGAAEVILKEWDSYLELLGLITECEANAEEGKGRIGQVHSDTSPHLASVVGPIANEDGYTVVPVLSSLSRLSRILNFPDGWEKYVAVDESTPQNERVTHLLAQGRTMMEARPGMSIRKYYGQAPRINADRFSLPYLCFIADGLLKKVSRDKKGEERQRSQEAINRIFYGAMRNTILRAAERSYIVWIDVLWQDIRALCARESVDMISKGSHSTNVIDLLAGQGVHRLDYWTDYWSFCSFGLRSITDIEAFGDMSGLGNLYHRVLSTLPNDSSPLWLGLDGISAFDIEEDMNFRIFQYSTRDAISLSITHIVPWVHRVLITRFKDVLLGAPLTRRYYDCLTRVLSRTIVGREGLRRILLSLLYYMHERGIGDSQAELFAEAIEEHLENGEVEGEVRLTSEDVSSAITWTYCEGE